MPLRKAFLYIIIAAGMIWPLAGYGSGTEEEGSARHPKDSAKTECLERARATARALQSMQDKTTHLWQKAGWWNSANIFESLIDFHKITGKNFDMEIHRVYKRNVYKRNRNFMRDNAFDDNEWWALAWLKAYTMTGNKKYEHIAELIFRDMIARSWDTVCGGGMRWENNGTYKNAVTNELFMTLSLRLSMATKDTAMKRFYFDWGMKEWLWFRHSGMYTDTAWITDGIGADCAGVFRKGLNLTYNQGIILGALKDLYTITSDTAYILEAKKIAYSSIRRYSNSLGVLTEPGKVTGGVDKNQFKGIFVRNLAVLNTVLHDDTIKAFILHNADYAWSHARDANNYFDFYWSGPYTEWSGSAQGSVMDLMNAALMQ
jgi:predicted alpha-1,6-mannanase (GH76 family)